MKKTPKKIIFFLFILAFFAGCSKTVSLKNEAKESKVPRALDITEITKVDLEKKSKEELQTNQVNSTSLENIIKDCLCEEKKKIEKKEKKKWGSEAELGIITTSGNTSTQSENGKFKIFYDGKNWKHELKLEGHHAADNEVTTAERFVAEGKNDIKIDEKNYFFLTTRYEADHFSGYDYRAIGVLGYGRKFEPTKNMTLEVEGGPGHRYSEVHKDESQNETIFRAALRYKWKITENSNFSEELTIESGADSTMTEAVTALKTQINKKLGMKITHTLRYNSRVPLDSYKTDSTTAVTLVYTFK